MMQNHLISQDFIVLFVVSWRNHWIEDTTISHLGLSSVDKPNHFEELLVMLLGLCIAIWYFSFSWPVSIIRYLRLVGSHKPQISNNRYRPTE